MYRHFFTTEMCPQRKMVEKRFAMIKSSGRKYVSVLGIIIAALLVSASVLAGGVLNDAVGVYGDGIIEVSYEGKQINLKNKPFAHNEEIYFPLRELLNACGVSDITYSSGNIGFSMYTPQMPEYPVMADVTVGENGIRFNLDSGRSDYRMELSGGKRSTTHPVLLKEDTAYVPLGVLIRIKDFTLDLRSGSETDYIDDFRYSRATRFYLLDGLKIIQNRGDGTYDVVLGTNYDVKGENRFSPENYYSDGERVFIGTADQQESYGYYHKEINGYHYPIDPIKRILIDNEGKVVAVVPVQNQKHEVLDRLDGDTFSGHHSWQQPGEGSGLISADFESVKTSADQICDPAYRQRMHPCFFVHTWLMVQPM